MRQTAAKFAGVREVLSWRGGGSGKTFDQSGFAKIAKHFRLALDAVLGESTRAHSHAIFIGDDLLLAPDFLLLFASAAPLLPPKAVNIVQADWLASQKRLSVVYIHNPQQPQIPGALFCGAPTDGDSTLRSFVIRCWL